MKQVLVRNAAWLVAERIVRFGSSVLVMAVLARYLGPSQFGALNYAASCVSLLTPFLAMGMNRTLVREFVTDRHTAAALLLVALRARILLGLLLVCALMGVITLAADSSVMVATLIAVTSVSLLLQAFEPLELWYQSLGQNRVPALVKAGSLLLTSVLKLALVFSNAPVVAFAWASVLELGINAATLACLYRETRPGLSLRTQLAMFRRLIAECWPEVIAGTGLSLCLRLDQLVLEATRGLAVVGVYAAGTRLSDVWYFVPAAIVASYYPLLVEHRTKDPERYAALTRQMFHIVAASSVVIIVSTWLLADLLVDFVFGASYEGAALVLRLHVLGLLAMGFGVASGAWIFAENRARLSMWRTLAGVVVCIAGNALLTPTYGTAGAAVATVLSLYTAYYFFDLVPKSMRHLFLIKSHALHPLRLLAVGKALITDARRGLARAPGSDA
jgi:polysaccharide transporter, PST family